MNRSKIIILAVLTSLSLLAFQEAFSQSSEDKTLPRIVLFEINQTTTIEDGVQLEWNEFSWKTEATGRVRLYKDGYEKKGRSQLSNGEIGWPLWQEGYLKMRQGKAASFKLVAENKFGMVSKTLETMDEKKKSKSGKRKSKGSKSPSLPKILSFSVRHKTNNSENMFSFFWQTEGAENVQLFDHFGEVTSGTRLSNGKYGWPLDTNGEQSTSLNETETYKLVATSKLGSVSKDFTVIVNGRDCRVSVEIKGSRSKLTSSVGVIKIESGSRDKLLFDSPVNIVRDHRKGNDPTPYASSTITLSPGQYDLAPFGRSYDSQGDFWATYQPKRIKFTCIDGNNKKISFTTNSIER